MKIPFFRAYIDDAEIKLINEALQNNGAHLIDDLENEIKKYFNVKYAITTNNGTAAKHLSLCAMNLKRGDKIICSVNSFPSTPEVIRQFDAEPIFVDIEEDGLNISPKAFEKVLASSNLKKFKAAFIVHLGGEAAKMNEIYEIANYYNIKIIDDASRAMGAKYNGKLIGSDSRSFMSCFQVNPQIRKAAATTGIILTNEESIADRARLIRSHALVQNSVDKEGNLGYTYDVVDLGQKYDLDYLSAAYSMGQFKKLELFIKRRREIAARYTEAFKDLSNIHLFNHSPEHIFTQYIVKIDKNRDDFARKLMDKGISVGLHYVPLHLLKYYKDKYNYKISDFPNSLKAYGQILSLPIFASMSDNEVDYVIKSIREISQKHV